MSRLYDTIEPSVIDEQMLNEAVEEQGPKGEAGRIAKQEGIDFGDVLYLRLDFKSKIVEYSFSENCSAIFLHVFNATMLSFYFVCEDILKIDNLWSFVNLTKLQMDNNIIERLEGLEMLVNLEWLGICLFIFLHNNMFLFEGYKSLTDASTVVMQLLITVSLT